ncbi:hypothetical protein CPB84DRAFT_1752416 [Gymnopilus junonius]|uniref:Uncharacterized protein n=1 Tax=Gymnopilus junonius TaxID=109634 RepID=A0A9P5TFZ9_GYMJU|nr:hypothetical protein CPB84DRAFT_1752416 [Gymnopilus junonius]
MPLGSGVLQNRNVYLNSHPKVHPNAHTHAPGQKHQHHHQHQRHSILILDFTPTSKLQFQRQLKQQLTPQSNFHRGGPSSLGCTGPSSHAGAAWGGGAGDVDAPESGFLEGVGEDVCGTINEEHDAEEEEEWAIDCDLVDPGSVTSSDECLLSTSNGVYARIRSRSTSTPISTTMLRNRQPQGPKCGRYYWEDGDDNDIRLSFGGLRLVLPLLKKMRDSGSQWDLSWDPSCSGEEEEEEDKDGGYVCPPRLGQLDMDSLRLSCVMKTRSGGGGGVLVVHGRVTELEFGFGAEEMEFDGCCWMSMAR